MGIKVVSGDISFIVSQSGYEANDEDRQAMGASVSYALPNGMKVGAYTVKGDDDFESGIPESFNVLVKEIRSLALNLELN